MPDPARLGAPGSGLVTLAGIPPLLGDDATRKRLTAGVRDQVLRDFWGWYEEMSPASRAAAVGPLMNKLRAFLLRKFAHAAIAAGPSTFNMAEVLDSGGLCLARLPKGILGEETAQLVGSFIVARTWQAASRRARLPEHARPDAGLYIDECQNFLNLPYPLEDMLAEARAYRLAVTMAHQNLAQLPPDLRQGISANARSQVIFSVSPEDARDLEHHTAPVLTAHDLSHLDAYQAAARLVASSAETPAFTFRTRPLPPPVPGRARLVRKAARAAHSATPGTARHRPAAQGCRSRPPAAPAYLTLPSRRPKNKTTQQNKKNKTKKKTHKHITNQHTTQHNTNTPPPPPPPPAPAPPAPPAAQRRRTRPPAAPAVPDPAVSSFEEDTPCLPTSPGPAAPRASGRLARSPQLAAELAARLTARDRWLLRMICEHRVLTTGQVTQLAFGTGRAATARMTTLYQYRAVDRFRPLAPTGSSPLHFILDEAGAMLLAAEDGITTADLGYRRDRSMAIALSPRLAHNTGANGIFTALAAAARASGGQAGAGVLVGRAALRRRLGRPRPPRRVRPLVRAAPRPAARHGRLLPRVRHRHRAADPGHRQARRVRRPRRPHRHHHPRPVLAAERTPGGRAARPAGRPAAARHPRCRLGRADPRRPGRDRRRRHQPRRPGRGGLAARRKPRPAPAARPAHPARHRTGRRQPVRRDRGRPARRPGLAPAVPRPARLERPARRAPPRPGHR